MRTWVLLPLLLAFGCRDEQAGPKPRTAALPPPASAALLLDAPPSNLTHRSEATWADGAVRYLGSRVGAGQPGQPVQVAHYFRAEAPPPQGYQFFVHVVDPATGQQLGNADHELQGGAMPLARFPVGKVVEDLHVIALPEGVGPVELRLGFWRGDERLPVDSPSAHDGTHRVRGPTVGAGGPPLPEYRAPRAKIPPVIDGRLDDAIWKIAPVATLNDSFDGRPASLATRAKLAWDEENLYVAFEVEDPDIWGTFRKRDDPIYTEEAVEVFLDANGDGRDYVEVQVSPHNVLFDAAFVSRRSDLARARIWDSGAQTAVQVRGTLDDDQRDEGWTVELRLPLDRLPDLGRAAKRGDRFRFNLYRLEAHRRRDVEGMSFSPLFVGDFHALPRFGHLILD